MSNFNYINYNPSYNDKMYELFCDFQKEDNFYKEHTYEEFKERLLENKNFQEDACFLCIDGENLVGMACGFVNKNDLENVKASGYIHTFIVKKEYRRMGIGSKLLSLLEEHFKACKRTSSRLVFLSPINWPWYIPHTDKHIHPGCPAVVINSEYYIFLYHHGYFVNSIHEGFHLNLSDYSLPEKVRLRMEENAKEGLTVELYDEKKHFGVREFASEVREEGNPGFARSIEYNLDREKPYPFVVALDHNRVCGWTGAIYTEPSGRGHLDGITVSSKIRGKGLGTGVFAKLCTESKKNGATYMTFFTGLDNPARYIYLGAGFNIACSFADMKKNL